MAEALGGLLLDAAGQDLAGGHVDRQLAGDMVVVGEGDGLGVQGAARCLVGIAGADHQVVPVFHQLGRGAVAVGDDHIHLYPCPHGQGGGTDYRAGRQVGDGAGDGGIREEGGVDLVDRVEIRQVGQVDGDLDDVVKGHVDPLQHRLDVVQALGRLLADTAANQGAGDGVDGQLGTDIVVVGEGDRLAGERILRGAIAASGKLEQGAGSLGEGAFAVGEQGVHLHPGTQRQGGDGEHGAGRQMVGEELAIDGVDCLQIGDIRQEQGHLHHVLHAVADALDDGLDIGKALSGLGLDIPLDHLARPGIDGELGGNIVVVGEGHALGIGAQILWGVGGISGRLDDGTTHGDTPFSFLM